MSDDGEAHAQDEPEDFVNEKGNGKLRRCYSCGWSTRNKFRSVCHRCGLYGQLGTRTPLAPSCTDPDCFAGGHRIDHPGCVSYEARRYGSAGF